VVQMRSRVICIPLMSRFQLWSDSSGSLKKRPLEIPGLDGLLPHAEGIWVESRTTGCADGDIDWNLVGYVGFDRDSELPQGQNFFNISGAGVTLAGSQKNDATNFGSFYYRQHLRLELVWKLVAGSSAKQAELSANMYVKTAGM